jgi:hypothetical protein
MVEEKEKSQLVDFYKTKGQSWYQSVSPDEMNVIDVFWGFNIVGKGKFKFRKVFSWFDYVLFLLICDVFLIGDWFTAQFFLKGYKGVL